MPHRRRRRLRPTLGLLMVLGIATAACEAPATTPCAPSSQPAATSTQRAAPGSEWPSPSVTLPAPLARVLTDYETAWRARDADALAALFAEDGFVLPSGRPPVRGRDRIREHYADSGGPLSLRALAFRQQGDVAFIIGGYAREPGQPDVGKFTLTLVRVEDGRWLIQSDMDNGNQRPP